MPPPEARARKEIDAKLSAAGWVLQDKEDYHPALPVEEFDFLIIDECHRSIYNLWRQTLEYFDAYLIRLTATPSALTLGFFKNNLVCE
jgi:type I site-specific restriction endonuclease